uniref:hypothetical protein n=1 Tax=Skeletonema potamos TaxID=1429247 RepID=UPI001D11D31F|nr:hypothetical protein LKZ53_mgp05 [Skeletonema potamos]UBA16259.1 hypothetical protein [Skeletonema potamos]
MRTLIELEVASQQQKDFLIFFNISFVQCGYKIEEYHEEALLYSLLNSPNLLKGLDDLRTKGIRYPDLTTHRNWNWIQVKFDLKENMDLDLCEWFSLFQSPEVHLHSDYTNALNFDVAMRVIKKAERELPSTRNEIAHSLLALHEGSFNNFRNSNSFRREVQKLSGVESNNVVSNLLYDSPIENLLKELICHFFNFINNWWFWIENCPLSLFSTILRVLLHIIFNWYCCITLVKIVFSFKRILKKFKQN